jgi:PAS domain S-box-containing protein
MAKNVDPPDHNKTKEQLIRALNLLRSEMADLSQKLIHPNTKKLDLPVGETEPWLRSLIDQAPGSLAMFDRQMRYLSVSRRWLSDFKLGERDLIGLSHYEVFPEISENWKNIHRRVLEGEVLRAEEDRFERADGSVQYLRWEVRPWQVSPGEIGGIIIYTEDITERKQAEEALKEKEEKYRALFENMAQGAFYQRSDGVVVDANPAVLKMLGITRDEGIGHTSYDFKLKVVGEDGSSLAPEEHPSMIALQTGKPVMNVVCGVSSPESMSYTWLSINAIPMFRSTEKRPYQVFVTLHDITDIKKTEEALRASEQRLHLALDAAF